MKYFAAVISASTLAGMAASPALASGACVYSGYNKGSPDIFKFVKWEFGKLEGRWLTMKLTVHNTLNQPVTRFELSMLVDGTSISLNKKQLVPAASDVVVTADYEMSDRDAAGFQSRTPLICVRVTEDTNGARQRYE